MQRKIAGLLLINAALCFLPSGCATDGKWKTRLNGSFPNNEEGALALLKEFIRPNADYAALSNQLRPTKADYEVVFKAEFAQKLYAVYDPVWDSGQLIVTPRTEQTIIKLYSATSDEMKIWKGGATEFSEAWKVVAPKLKTNVQIHGFKFVERGRDLGTVYEGLVYVNGNWRFFPKPWRAIS